MVAIGCPHPPTKPLVLRIEIRCVCLIGFLFEVMVKALLYPRSRTEKLRYADDGPLLLLHVSRKAERS